MRTLAWESPIVSGDFQGIATGLKPLAMTYIFFVAETHARFLHRGGYVFRFSRRGDPCGRLRTPGDGCSYKTTLKSSVIARRAVARRGALSTKCEEVPLGCNPLVLSILLRRISVDCARRFPRPFRPRNDTVFVGASSARPFLRYFAAARTTDGRPYITAGASPALR